MKTPAAVSAASRPSADLTWRQWWWLPAVWIVLFALFSLQPWLLGWMSWGDAVFRFGMLQWLPWVPIAPLAVWLSLRCPIAGPRWRRALLLHLLVGFVAVAALEWSNGIFRFERLAPLFNEPGARAEARGDGDEPRPTLTFPSRREPPPAGRFPLRRDGMPRPPWWALTGRRNLPFYCTLLAAAHVLYFRIAARRNAAMEAQLTAARLAALQTQLQPHFLFNALNAISTLVHSNPVMADEMICALGSLLHAALDKRHRAEVSLAEELELARRYLRIQEIRFGAALRIELHIEPAAEPAAVPTLSLQPLLENAITHGLRGQPGAIQIAARLAGDRAVIEVTDRPQHPFATATVPHGSGIGLGNIRARLATLHGDAATCRLQTGPLGATATLDLPFRPLDVPAATRAEPAE